MRYMLLIASDENAFAAFSPEEQESGLAGYVAFSEEMTKRGVLKGGERLRPTSDAITVQVRDGETLTTDGPFVETKEQIGGYFIIEAKDQAEAIEIASKCPGAHHGTVEVRPIWDM
jgi:hypothetical protein